MCIQTKLTMLVHCIIEQHLAVQEPTKGGIMALV
jgi:hypothetical protein